MKPILFLSIFMSSETKPLVTVSNESDDSTCCVNVCCLLISIIIFIASGGTIITFFFCWKSWFTVFFEEDLKLVFQENKIYFYLNKFIENYAELFSNIDYKKANIIIEMIF